MIDCFAKWPIKSVSLRLGLNGNNTYVTTLLTAQIVTDINDKNLSVYVYYTKDHLGNVRHVASFVPKGSGSISQVNNYYPFGSLLNEDENRLTQNKLYNGKELDRMHRLNMYDYSARQYDAAIGQFTSMDLLCEKYYHINPYAYCVGNPVKYVDPDGRWIANVFGAIAGSAFELGAQLVVQQLTNGHINLSAVDWADVGVSALEGG